MKSHQNLLSLFRGADELNIDQVISLVKKKLAVLLLVND